MVVPFLFSLLITTPVVASEVKTADGTPRLPKWEIGAAAGYFKLPDYPGSDEKRNRNLSLPSIVYRGKLIQGDRDGWKSRFLKGESYEFDLSFGAGFPSKSSDNKAREGMPDLNWIGEVGPRLVLHLWHERASKLNLNLPIRYVFSTDLQKWESLGLVFNPELKARFSLRPTVLAGVNIGGTWAGEELTNYFYEVKEQFATAERPSFDAQAGYFATNTNVFLIKNWNKKLTTFMGISKNYYSNAKNRESPLLKDKETESYFFGLNWTLYVSQELQGVRLKP